MAVTFNAGEIFEIAQQIERNGARFYERASGSVGEAETASLLLTLAEMEHAHERVFARMRRELTPEQKLAPFYDPDGESTQYLRALAGGQVFNLRADPGDWLGPNRSRADILHKAIAIENDSILFYLGMREAVPEDQGRERIDGIIKQEMGHVSLLAARLRPAEQ